MQGWGPPPRTCVCPVGDVSEKDRPSSAEPSNRTIIYNESVAHDAAVAEELARLGAAALYIPDGEDPRTGLEDMSLIVLPEGGPQGAEIRFVTFTAGENGGWSPGW